MAQPLEKTVRQLLALQQAGMDDEGLRATARAAGWESLAEVKAAWSSRNDTAKNLGRATAQGVAHGYGDEAIAAGRAAVGGETYADAVAHERAALKGFRSENPKTAMAAEFVGALLPGSVTAKLAQGATAVGTMVRSALLGGAQGAVYGSGAADDGDRASGAFYGGAAGALIAPAITGVTGVLLAGLRALAANRLPKEAAEREVALALQRDGISPKEAQQMLRDLQSGSSEVRLADIGGENTKKLLAGALNRPNAGRERGVQILTDRQKGQLGRVIGGLGRIMGSRRDALAAIEESANRAKQVALPYKDKAMQVDLSNHPQIVAKFQELAKRQSGKDAIRWGQRLANNEGTPGPIDVDNPTMRDVDLFLRGLNTIIDNETSFQPGLGNKVSPFGRTVVGIKKELTDLLDDPKVGIPDYAQYRALWSGEASFASAIKDGSSFVNMKPSELRDRWSRMSESDRVAFRIGALQALEDQMGRTQARLPDFMRVFRSPNMQSKIETILPDAAKQKWASLQKAEDAASETASVGLTGSRTGWLMAEHAEADSFGEMAIDMMADALRGTSFYDRAARWLTWQGAKMRAAVREKYRAGADDKLVDYMMSRPALAKQMIAATGKPSVVYQPGGAYFAQALTPAMVANSPALAESEDLPDNLPF